jgi:hypothetical protein
MAVCSVPECRVTEKTSHSSPKYQKVKYNCYCSFKKANVNIKFFIQVHPNARGKLFKLTGERRKVWKDLLEIDNDSENLYVCACHFSLVQYHEVRLARACVYNILLNGASPDLAIPGKEDDPSLPVYIEP